MNDEHPRVFVSHASEDKERFVKKFSTLLLENGVDAWTSFWEINDGDSLIKKIFDEGIEESSQFIVVLSKYSINKPWVQKELSIAIVKQIEEKYKIIPILLDNVSIPTSLKDTQYRRIKDLINIENDTKETINSIFGLYNKPNLGKIPVFDNYKTFSLPNLSKLDNIILDICFDLLPERDQKPYILDLAKLIKISKDKGIEENDVHDSLLFLKSKYFLTGDYAYIGSKQILIYPQFTTWGFQQLASLRIAGFTQLTLNIATYIYNEFSNNEYIQLNSYDIAQKFNLSYSYSRYFVKIIEEKKFCKISETIGCIWIKCITPDLRRWMENKN